MLKLRYVSVWIVRGATDLDVASEFELISSSDPEVQVLLTSDLEAWSKHIDRHAALRGIILAAGLADTPGKTDLRNRAMETTRSKRRQDFPRGVFLVLNAAKPHNDDLPNHRVLGDFGVIIDAIDNDSIRDEFRRYLAAAAAATLSFLPAAADRRAEPVGGSVYFIDSADNRPIYNFSVQFGTPTLSINGLLATEIVPTVSSHAALLAEHENLGKVTQLQLAAMNEREAFGRFVLSWAALEMFIHSTFSERYEMIATSARADVSSSLGRILRPFLRQESGGFPVRARFSTIAHTLAPLDVMQDGSEFGELKAERDSFIHSGKLPNLDAHAKRTQALLLKFLGLELAARASI